MGRSPFNSPFNAVSRRSGRSSYPTPGSIARMGAGYVARGVLNSPYVRAATGAYQVARTGIKAYKSARRLFTNKKSRGSSTGTGSTTAGRGPIDYGRIKYAGKFKKARTVKSPNLFISKGFENTTEVVGTVTDPNCVYIAASASSSICAVEAIAQALIRAAYEKCVGEPVTNIRNVLRGYNNITQPWADGDGFRFEMTWVNVSTLAEGRVVHTTNATDSIYSMVGELQAGIAPTWPTLITQLKHWCSGTAGVTNAELPMRFSCYRQDGNVQLFYLGSGSIDLRNVTVHYHSKIDLKLQNRSLAADGGVESDNVSANPLIGYKYEFNHGSPYFKNVDNASGTAVVSRIFDLGGVALARGGNFGATSVMREPPKPQFFNNCVKSVKVTLPAGDLKYTKLAWKANHPFLKMLQIINCQDDGGAVRQTVRSPGKCVMFALEDMINVNALQNIQVVYEINRVTGCYITEKKPKVAQGTFTALTRNEP